MLRQIFRPLSGSGQVLRLVLGLLGLLLLAQGCSSRVVRPPNSPSVDPTAERLGQAGDRAMGVVQTARGQIGAPYVYGGDSPDEGFDCSGLVYWVYRQNGVEVPRVSGDQYRVGKPVTREELKPGDMVFFKLPGKGSSLHAAIYSGQETFIHSPKAGSSVREEPLEARYWLGHYLGARRVVQDNE